MENKQKKLGEAELEIMQAIWGSNVEVTSNYILKELQGKRKWKLSTLMTSLSRLEDKGFVACDRSAGVNLYKAAVAEKDYKVRESRNFLERLYNNSIQNLVAALYDSRTIRDEDIQELRRFLDRLEEEQSGR